MSPKKAEDLDPEPSTPDTLHRENPLPFKLLSLNPYKSYIVYHRCSLRVHDFSVADVAPFKRLEGDVQGYTVGKQSAENIIYIR
jgi:hypothetical protein